MADELPSLHIDTDWKKQAQEEKRRLMDEQQKRAAKPPTAPAAPAGLGPVAPAAALEPAAGRVRGRARARCPVRALERSSNPS